MEDHREVHRIFLVHFLSLRTLLLLDNVKLNSFKTNLRTC